LLAQLAVQHSQYSRQPPLHNIEHLFAPAVQHQIKVCSGCCRNTSAPGEEEPDCIPSVTSPDRAVALRCLHNLAPEGDAVEFIKHGAVLALLYVELEECAQKTLGGVEGT